MTMYAFVGPQREGGIGVLFKSEDPAEVARVWPDFWPLKLRVLRDGEIRHASIVEATRVYDAMHEAEHVLSES